MDHGATFIDYPESKDIDRRSLHLALARSSIATDMPKKFEVLSRRGCDIHARDADGRNVLMILLQNMGIRSPSLKESLKESLTLLIQKGADVYAYDDDFSSVSEYAYGNKCPGDCAEYSYVGDVWDAVLSELGYDIRETRKGYPRKPMYTSYHTREEFEDLWRGREENCPYYDDPPVWDAEKGSLWDISESDAALFSRPQLHGGTD